MPNINVKVTDKTMDILVEKAKENETTVSHEVRQILKKELENKS